MNCEFCLATVASDEPQCPNCGGPVRLVRHKDPSKVALLAGTEVLAKSSDGSWGRGEILEFKEEGESTVYRVARKGKEPKWMQRAEITVDGDVPADIDQAYEPGDRVSCKAGDGTWHDGTVGASYGRVYRIDFDTRDVAWMHPERIRFVEPGRVYGRRRRLRYGLVAAGVLVVVLAVISALVDRGSDTQFSVREAQIDNENVPPDLPPPALEQVDGLPPPGTLVLARFGGTGDCYLGRVAGGPGGDHTALIQFLDGRVAPRSTTDLYNDVVGPGSRVDARRSDGEWHRGTVRERDRDRVLVAFDEGDDEWQPLDAIRLHCR